MKGSETTVESGVGCLLADVRFLVGGKGLDCWKLCPLDGSKLTQMLF